MKQIVKALCLCLILIFSTTVSAQQKDYTVKKIGGSVEYRQTDKEDWQPLKRLTSISLSSILNIPEGGEVTVYSKAKPQPLRIAIPGQKKLRILIKEAEKMAAEQRHYTISDLYTQSGKKPMPAGVSYRGKEDDKYLISLYNAVHSPISSANAPLALTLLEYEDNGDKGFNVELSNRGENDVYVAVIIKVADTYSALSISGDPENMRLLGLPAGMKLTVPDCIIEDIEGLEAFALASPTPFSPENLCVLLNSPKKPEAGNDSEGGIVAVEASVRSLNP